MGLGAAAFTGAPVRSCLRSARRSGTCGSGVAAHRPCGIDRALPRVGRPGSSPRPYLQRNGKPLWDHELVPAGLEVRGGKNGRVIGAGKYGWGFRGGVFIWRVGCGGGLALGLRTGGRAGYDKSAALHEARGARSTRCNKPFRLTGLTRDAQVKRRGYATKRRWTVILDRYVQFTLGSGYTV